MTFQHMQMQQKYMYCCGYLSGNCKPPMYNVTLQGTSYNGDSRMNGNAGGLATIIRRIDTTYYQSSYVY